MRKRIFEIVERAERSDRLSHVYDIFITVVALISIFPLLFKETNAVLDGIDLVTVYILFADYIFRWVTYDFKNGKKGWLSFVKYPFTPMAIIELAAILPSLAVLGPQFRILRMLRLFRALQYSKNFIYIANVFKRERKTLTSVLVIALAYIFISALAMFCYEPDTFENFFHALYWATTALTTVGYGDIYPVTWVGQLISMISSLFGVAIIALPAGVVTAGFMSQLERENKQEDEDSE